MNMFKHLCIDCVFWCGIPMNADIFCMFTLVHLFPKHSSTLTSSTTTYGCIYVYIYLFIYLFYLFILFMCLYIYIFI